MITIKLHYRIIFKLESNNQWMKINKYTNKQLQNKCQQYVMWKFLLGTWDFF